MAHAGTGHTAGELSEAFADEVAKAMDGYRHKYFEELRLEDYSASRFSAGQGSSVAPRQSGGEDDSRHSRHQADCPRASWYCSCTESRAAYIEKEIVT